MRCKQIGLLMLAIWLPAGLALATEGGLGRSVTGMQGHSAAAVLPATAGWMFSFSSINYQGDMDASRSVPMLGQVSHGMDVALSWNLASLGYVWPGSDAQWSFASRLGLPFQFTRLQASLAAEDRSADMADILLTPIMASYHISEQEHFSLSLPLYAPTGDYDTQQLANTGQNVWTVMPTLAFTRLDGKGGEFTSQAALEIYSRNSDTQYRSGGLFRLDVFWLAPAGPGGLGWGIAGGWLQQLDDDDGPGSSLSSGFKGAALGFGPMLNWRENPGRESLVLNLRWVPEFYARNRPRGNGLSLGIELPLR